VAHLGRPFRIPPAGLHSDRALEYPYREISCTLRSYLVRSDRARGVARMGEGRDFTNGRPTDSPETPLDLLPRDLPVEGFGSLETPYHGFEGWTTGASPVPRRTPSTSISYGWEGNNYGRSVEENPSACACLPAASRRDGALVRRHGGVLRRPRRGRLVARDTGVDLSEPDALVIRRDALESVLAAQGLSIVWTSPGRSTSGRTTTSTTNGTRTSAGERDAQLVDGVFRGVLAPIYQNRRGTSLLSPSTTVKFITRSTLRP
jgi:hypothetical protein